MRVRANVVRLVALALLCGALCPGVARGAQGPSTYGMNPEDVASALYTWYVAERSTPDCAALAARAYLFEPSFADLLCPPGSAGNIAAAAAVRHDPFSGTSKASSFRIRKVEVDGD